MVKNCTMNGCSMYDPHPYFNCFSPGILYNPESILIVVLQVQDLLTRDELQIMSLFRRLDTDSDGLLSRAEFAEGIRQTQVS